jgi:hypothetical protein
MTGQVLDSERRRSAVRLPALQSPVLLETAAALPHARGLSPARSTTAAPPRPRPIDGRCTQPHPRAGRAGSGQTRDGSRVHSDSFVEVGARLCPCGIAASTPQSFLAASLAARTHRLGSSPPTHSTGAHRSRPRSTRFEPVPNQGGVTRRFLAYSSPSRLPDPHHLAVLARPGVVRAAPTLPGTTRISRVGAAHYFAASGSDGALLRRRPLGTVLATYHRTRLGQATRAGRFCRVRWSTAILIERR